MRSVILAIACGVSACSLTDLDDLRGSSTDAGAETASDAPVDATPMDAPPHAITFVQEIDDNYSSLGLTFKSPVLDGDAVIVVVANSFAGAVTVSDSSSNSYTTIVPQYSASDGGTVSVFVLFDAKGGFSNLKVSPPDGGTGYIYYAAEYAGITKFDGFATGSTQSTGTDQLVTSSVVTMNAPELLFAYAEGLGNVDPGSSFQERSLFDGNTIEERIVNTTGSYQATATLMSGTGDIVLVCFH